MIKQILFTLSLFFIFLNATTVQTDKLLYDYDNGDSNITVNFSDMNGTATDWIGIYPSGSSYEFENVVAWKWTKGQIEGAISFNLLNAGNYDVRAFFKNSLTKRAEYTFSIIGEPAIIPDVNLTTTKVTYLNTDIVPVTFQYMQGNTSDWIGIYPIGSNYEFKNVITYKQTDGDINGTINFENLPVGEYDIRAFFNNSLSKEASTSITITADPSYHDVNLTTPKPSYLNTDTVTVSFQYMQGNSSDWIGVYPAGASYNFENVVSYKQTSGDINGSIDFNDLPVGEYDIRAFFNNSLSKEASISITVIADPDYHEVTLELDKNGYAQNELIYVKYNYMQGNKTDWIGIYPAGASYEFNNVIDWGYLNGSTSGEISLGGFPANTQLKGSTAMPALAPGEYEVRAFFKNSLSTIKVKSFTITEQNVTSTIYEEAKQNISPNWQHISGPYPPQYIVQEMVRLKANWINNTTNTSEYTLNFDAKNTTQKVLELDVGGAGRWTPHFNIGVIVQTTDGERRMLWDSFLNHYQVSANIQGHVLSFPTYIELQNGTKNNQKHFRVNVDKYLKILEPNNKVISISSFFATGGDLDNIKLSSH